MFPKNIDAVLVYQKSGNQALMAPMGGAYALRGEAVIAIMDMMEREGMIFIESRTDLYDKVMIIAAEVFKKDE